jgi:hypothetical protein
VQGQFQMTPTNEAAIATSTGAVAAVVVVAAAAAIGSLVWISVLLKPNLRPGYQLLKPGSDSASVNVVVVCITHRVSSARARVGCVCVGRPDRAAAWRRRQRLIRLTDEMNVCANCRSEGRMRRSAAGVRCHFKCSYHCCAKHNACVYDLDAPLFGVSPKSGWLVWHTCFLRRHMTSGNISMRTCSRERATIYSMPRVAASFAYTPSSLNFPEDVFAEVNEKNCTTKLDRRLLANEATA